MKFHRKADDKKKTAQKYQIIHKIRPARPGLPLYFVLWKCLAVVVLRLEIKIQNSKHSASVITYTQRSPSVLRLVACARVRLLMCC